MVRSVGMLAMVAGLAWTGLAEAQSSSPLEKARYINVSEEGKSPQRCKIVKTWRDADGDPVFQVQAVDTGEIMTIVGTAPKGTGGDRREMTTRIFRWGRDNKPPTGAPLPPPTSTTLTQEPPQQPALNSAPAVTQSLKPTPVATTPKPTLIAPIPQKSNTAAPTQPIIRTNTLTTSKPVSSSVVPKPVSTVTTKTPKLTPMGTQVVQYSSAPPQAKLPDVPKATASQPRLTPLPTSSAGTPNACNCPCPQPCNSCCNPCGASGQSSCICNTPSPMRQPLIGRLFKSNPCSSCTTVASQAPATVPTQSLGTNAVKPVAPTNATPTIVTASSEPAKPGDWRQSWGKVEPWKGSTQANTVKPIEVSKRVDSMPVKMVPAKQPDPLKDPSQYRDIVMNSRMSNSKVPPPAQSPTGRKLFGAKPPLQPARPVEEITIVNAPPNSGLPQGKMILIPADEPNAFSPPQSSGAGQEKTKFNAFAREPEPPPQGTPPSVAGVPPALHGVPPALPGLTMGPLPPGPQMNMPTPPLPATAMQRPMNMAADAGVPNAMANAFTLAGTSRPIPADFGGTPQEPNGFAPPVREGQGSPPRAYGMGTGTPGAYRPQMSNMMAMQQPAAMGVNPLMTVPPSPSYGQAVASPAASAQPTGVPQMLAALKDSLRPSEREAAAEQLSELNWRIQPQVVASLMKAAHDDPAATVRAACIHALAHMKVDSPAALDLVRQLKSDRDAQVRHEAEEAQNALGDSGIQQATHK